VTVRLRPGQRMTTRRSCEPEVLILTPDFPPDIGGIQTLVWRTAMGLTDLRPRVVTLEATGAKEFDRRQPFAVVRVPVRAGHRMGIGALNTVAAVSGLRIRPQVILSGHLVTGPAAIALGRLLRKPFVQLAHGQELTRRSRLAAGVLRRAHSTVAVSKYSKSLVEDIAGSGVRVRVEHPGVDCPALTPTPAMANQSIVVVARLAERYKGHDILLRSLVRVRERLPEANLHIVGDGPLRLELERFAHELGVASATTFHGQVSDGERDAILRGATVFAMPSRVESGRAGEGFGIAYVEAGAMGLPVVAGKVGGAVDAVIDGKTGLLVDAEDPDAVAGALVTLLESPARAKEIGRAGWEHARVLTWRRFAGSVEAALEDAIAS
jgi:phosphatidylinositol alpha-1,6-mannosyltransferase